MKTPKTGFLMMRLVACWPCNPPHMSYLTLWDKISQNLAHLEASSHKIFKSHWIFRPSYNTFYEEINIHHTLLCLLQAFYIIIKGFWLFWGSFKVIFVKISQNFIKSHLKHCLISQISATQLMACMNPRIFGPRNAKTCLMRTSKVQINLRIRAVWSAPLLFTA